jgi:hypothetical protein
MVTEEERLRRIIYQREDRIRSLQRENCVLVNQVKRLKPFPNKYDALWSETEELKHLYANQGTVIAALLELARFDERQKVAVRQKYQYEH